MKRTSLIASLGSMLGILVAFSMPASLGMEGFSGTTYARMLGYGVSIGIGAVIGFAAGEESGFASRVRAAGAGATLALLMTYVVRQLPMPWVNLVWLDGTAGPLGEVPFVLLPFVGLIVGGVFGAAKKAAP